MMGDDIASLMANDERLRREIIGIVELMGAVVVPSPLYEKARALLPELADKIIKSERMPAE